LRSFDLNKLNKLNNKLRLRSKCYVTQLTGELYRYWWQNTEEKDFIDITTKFILRLINRGHQPNSIIPLIQTAASNIDSLNIKASQQKPTDDTKHSKEMMDITT
jgi:hypothetical protein